MTVKTPRGALWAPKIRIQELLLGSKPHSDPEVPTTELEIFRPNAPTPKSHRLNPETLNLDFETPNF